ncbi:hypothetical protein H6P81_012169 [Aristolochia fimbriata]|uniref:Secreted protein n=1 Tax=Aristolochia fimbriata TaxID=158543 RepID=A0AAV7EE47_ARIFI|nr:hypothetical protein H6P81_012169 [Aristolochia fimbriata]
MSKSFYLCLLLAFTIISDGFSPVEAGKNKYINVCDIYGKNSAACKDFEGARPRPWNPYLRGCQKSQLCRQKKNTKFVGAGGSARDANLNPRLCNEYFSPTEAGDENKQIHLCGENGEGCKDLKVVVSTPASPYEGCLKNKNCGEGPRE